MATQSNFQMKVVEGQLGYVLQDVPHITDYIPNLPVCVCVCVCLFLAFALRIDMRESVVSVVFRA